MNLQSLPEDRWRHVQMTDLFAAGVTALEEAIRTYQASREGPLRPYVITAIERALDALAYSIRIQHPSASQIPAPRSQTKARAFQANARVSR